MEKVGEKSPDLSHDRLPDLVSRIVTTLRDTDTYTTYTPPLCHLELLFPPDKSLTWPTLCWVFKDNYKARSNTSPPNIWKEQVREDGGRYDKQGSAYAIRINRKANHRKDRGS